MGHEDPLLLDAQHLTQIIHELLGEHLAVLGADVIVPMNFKVHKGRGGIPAAEEHLLLVLHDDHEPALPLGGHLLP